MAPLGRYKALPLPQMIEQRLTYNIEEGYFGEAR